MGQLTDAMDSLRIGNAAQAQMNVYNNQFIGNIAGTTSYGGSYGGAPIYRTNTLGQTFVTVTSNPWMQEPVKEAKKIAKKAFARLMDEITEWHGDILAV